MINRKIGRGQLRKTNLEIMELLSLSNYEEIKRLADKRDEWLQQGKAFRKKKQLFSNN